MSEKQAYTPAEFAALFGRTKTWTYRLHYAGKIKCIKDYGKLMVPASEAARIVADTVGYQSKAEVERNKQLDDARASIEPERGSAKWTAWVSQKKAGKKPTGRNSKNGPLNRRPST